MDFSNSFKFVRLSVNTEIRLNGHHSYKFHISRHQKESAFWLANNQNIGIFRKNFRKSVFFDYGRIENWDTDIGPIAIFFSAYVAQPLAKVTSKGFFQLARTIPYKFSYKHILFWKK